MSKTDELSFQKRNWSEEQFNEQNCNDVAFALGQQQWRGRRAGTGPSDYSFPVVAGLQHFSLKELQCVPEAAVLEAGLFMGAPAPRQPEGLWVMLQEGGGAVSREPGIVSDRHFCCIIEEATADTFLSACHIPPSQTLRGPGSPWGVCKQMPLKSLETAPTASVPESIMSGMLFLLFTASLFRVSPCPCKVCIYEQLVAKIRECGVLANPFFHYFFVFLFPTPLLCCFSASYFCFFFHLLPSMAMIRVCSSEHASQALQALPPPLSKKSVFKEKKKK